LGGFEFRWRRRLVHRLRDRCPLGAEWSTKEECAAMMTRNSAISSAMARFAAR